MEKKQKVINAAIALFTEKGFEKTSMADIKKLAGVSTGLIYHHFENKNALLKEIFTSTTEIVEDINDGVDENKTPNNIIIDTINGAFEHMKKDKAVFKLYLNIMLEPTTREVLKDLIREKYNYLLQHAQGLFAHLPKEEQKVKSFLFVSDLDGIAINYIYSFDDYPLDLVQKEFIKRYTT